MPSAPRIGLFGGSFDPIHLGHLEVAQKARQSLELEKIIFIPCRQSPHKDQAPGATDRQRLEMLTLALQNLPWATIDPFELENPPPSYTWKTIRYLKNTLPDQAKLFLIIGEDQWATLPDWKNPEFIAQNTEIIVVGRHDQPQSRPGYQAHFLQGDHPASSTQIRKMIQSRQNPSWLPPGILPYLKEHHLYLTL